MNYWVQKSNFDIIEEDESLTISKLKDLINKFNWEKEQYLQKKLKKEKKETCPPTIGLSYEGQTFIIYSYKKDIFNIFLQVGRKKIEIKELNKESLFKLIEYYYKKEYKKIFEFQK